MSRSESEPGSGPESEQEPASGTYVVLSGGSGGVKLAVGLAQLLRERLSIIVNTGDDFTHLGLSISPDIDTVLYALSGRVNEETGWGLAGETWSFMRALGDLGGPTWFKLGDGDLATHVDRTGRLKAGEALTAVCASHASRLGVAAHILPMSDDPVRTRVATDAGDLSFQEYFVRDQCRPVVHAIRFDGATSARPAPRVLHALAAPTLRGILIGPSNPWLSVDPILAVPGLRQALKASGAPIVAVSPIIAGRAVKGPAAKIMAELGLDADTRSIARHYAGLLDGFVIDSEDEKLAQEIQSGTRPDIRLPTLATNTMMRTLDDKVALARQCLAFCGRLARERPARSRVPS
jgi:LPPG:FO 2-phospho-L-lactate transferase